MTLGGGTSTAAIFAGVFFGWYLLTHGPASVANFL